MQIEFGKHKDILMKLVGLLTKDYGEDTFLEKARSLLSEERIDVDTIKNILYGIVSFYLIDDVALQPVEKMNFIDMGSYYYRSESYNIDFPTEFHNKYQIPYPHLERRSSIFYSNKNFVQNYLNAKQSEELISISILQTEDPYLKMTSSRQLFLIEFFLLYPDSFKEMLLSKYSSKFRDSEVFKIRKEKNFDKFLCSRILEDLSDNEIRSNLLKLLTMDRNYILTSSGTSANQLVIEYLTSDNQKNFYHKYWYYENLGKNQSHYFHEIENRETDFDNFFINIRPTNFIDITGQDFTEDIEKELISLVKKLEKTNKTYNLVIDVTSNPFFNLYTNSKNINFIKTMSLSKYQEGLNTSFAGLVMAEGTDIEKMKPISDYFGFSIGELDKRFLLLPDVNQYRKRISKIENFTNVELPDYKGWSVCPIGLSLILVPNKKIMDYQIQKFSNQTKISDRAFTWLLRDRVNKLIKDLDLKDMHIGDSFLFPTSRMNMQGPSINASDYSENSHIFKYRLPRISPGYNTDLGDAETYYCFYKNVIDIYTEEYDKL